MSDAFKTSHVIDWSHKYLTIKMQSVSGTWHITCQLLLDLLSLELTSYSMVSQCSRNMTANAGLLL